MRRKMWAAVLVTANREAVRAPFAPPALACCVSPAGAEQGGPPRVPDAAAGGRAPAGQGPGPPARTQDGAEHQLQDLVLEGPWAVGGAACLLL